MSKIMISELAETTTAPDESYIAIDNGSETNKITIANYNANANHTAKRYADAAEGYADNAIAARDSAISAKNECETFVNSASNFANAASTNASAAAGSASEASGYVGSAQASASNALASARAADNSAADAANQVLQSKSWAQGNTGVRAGENTNNAKYWAEVAMGAAGGGVATFNGRFGAVLPEAGDYSSDQIAHVNSDDTYTNVEAALNEAQTNIAAAQNDIAEAQEDIAEVQEGIAGKLNTYASAPTQWDTTPTASSEKPVTSGGIYDALHQMSHVGMIIHSTTLDTEEKVKAIYGGNAWAKIEGRFLLGQSSSHTINSTGGSETVTLTVNQIPSHNHIVKRSTSYGDQGYAYGGNWNVGAETLSTNNTGGGQPHNNMPPYKTVYIWERTA